MIPHTTGVPFLLALWCGKCPRFLLIFVTCISSAVADGGPVARKGPEGLTDCGNNGKYIPPY